MLLTKEVLTEISNPIQSTYSVDHMGTTVCPLWDNFGTTLGPLADHMGTTWGPTEDIIWGTSEAYLGHHLGHVWGIILGMSGAVCYMHRLGRCLAFSPPDGDFKNLH